MTVKTRTPEGSERGRAVRAASGDGSSATEPVDAPAYERVDIDRYVVTRGEPVGYVDVVPPVMVCYSGHPYAQAVEVAQVHDFHHAVEVVLAYAGSSQRRVRAA